MAERFVNKAYRNDFMESIYKLRQKYTDVTLLADGAKIRCHRIVLAVASDYFKAMFGCGLKESTSDTVQMTMEPGTVTSIIDYMYTGEIELTIDNVESLVKACDFLQLNDLKAGCEGFMMAQVDLTNCVGFFRFAASYQLPTLHGKAKRLMLAEFKSVAFSDELKELSCDDLVELIKDDDVRVEDEDIVFETVLEWIRHDLENRESSIETILEHVRLPYCTGLYLWHMKDTCDLLTPKCQEYLHEALSFQADIVHQHEATSCRTLPRTNFRQRSCLLVVGGLPESKRNTIIFPSKLCHYYNEGMNRWESLTKIPRSVGFTYSVCFLGRSLLLTGGKGKGTHNECWLYDFVTKKWEAMPPLLTARHDHRSVSVGDCVYVVGGKAIGKVLASCECLNLKRRQWSSIPDLPEAALYSMVVTYGNKIIVFGGADAHNKSMRCTWVYDTMRGSWSAKSDMTEACSGGAAVTMNNCVYVVGGSDCTCLRYDFATDTWTQLSRPHKQHSYAPAVVWRGRILLAGGGPDPLLSLIEQYDPLTDTWSDWKTELSEKRMDHAMFVVDLCHM